MSKKKKRERINRIRKFLSITDPQLNTLFSINAYVSKTLNRAYADYILNNPNEFLNNVASDYSKEEYIHFTQIQPMSLLIELKKNSYKHFMGRKTKRGFTTYCSSYFAYWCDHPNIHGYRKTYNEVSIEGCILNDLKPLHKEPELKPLVEYFIRNFYCP